MTTNRPKRTHQPEPQYTGGGWLARCPCGWMSVFRLSKSQAELDCRQHAARAGGA